MVRSALAVLAAVVAPAWTRTDLPVPKAHPNMVAGSIGVNANGAAIYEGTYKARSGLHEAAFLWRHGKVTPLSASAKWVDVYAINRSGTVVGDVDARAAVWRDGKPTLLAAAPSSAQRINDRGTIIGQDDHNAAVWHDGTETLLDSIATVTAVNAHDAVIGETPYNGGLTHAMLWQNGVTTDLGTVGIASSWAVAINDSGEIVGRLATQTGFPLTAVAWQNGQLVDLGRFGALGAEAVAVNDAGDILVQLTDDAGNPSAIVLVRNGQPITIPGDVARAVDDQGQVLGYVTTVAHGRRSFVWRNGQETILPTSDGATPPFGGPNSVAEGWAIGDEYVALPDGHRAAHAVLWRRSP